MLSRVKLQPAPQPAPVGSAEFQDQLAAAGTQFRAAGVRYLYLIHGTFAGNDAFGLFGEIARYFPEVGESLRSMGKRTFDKIIGEAGNYTDEFADVLSKGLNADAGDSQPIAVKRFHWSSENHHIARADAAIELIDEFSKLELADGDRILLWCHSHAGNVLALLTNLLAADTRGRRQFYRACRSYYRWPKLGKIDMTHWPRVRDLLGSREDAALSIPIDIATFGTPVRYGWETERNGKLMHLVHHYVSDDAHPGVAPFPPSTKKLLSGHGDFIQQVGIAGTDFPPGPIIWRSWLADWRLKDFLAPKLPRRGLLNRLRFGQRIHADGKNLLIDYGPQEGTIAHHILGHAVYTRQKWMAFHASEIANEFYDSGNK